MNDRGRPDTITITAHLCARYPPPLSELGSSKEGGLPKKPTCFYSLNHPMHHPPPWLMATWLPLGLSPRMESRGRGAAPIRHVYVYTKQVSRRFYAGNYCWLPRTIQALCPYRNSRKSRYFPSVARGFIIPDRRKEVCHSPRLPIT